MTDAFRPAARSSWCAAKMRASIILLSLALLLAVSSCSKERSGPTAPSTPDTPTLEHQTFTKINDYRVSRGLPALEWSDVIAAQARQHSQNMASGATAFGHDGFDARVAAIAQAMPWSAAAENVALNRSAAGAVESWLNSPGHRENIEGNYTRTGVGTANAKDGSVYFTQIFIRPR